MYCKKCGNDVEDHTFCNKCGSRIDGSEGGGKSINFAAANDIQT